MLSRMDLTHRTYAPTYEYAVSCAVGCLMDWCMYKREAGNEGGAEDRHPKKRVINRQHVFGQDILAFVKMIAQISP